jgi:Fe-S oxidoreductase
MARMKIEFEHQWQREHGMALRDRLLAFLPRWAPFAARAAPLMNLRNRMPAIAALMQRPTGIAARRSLPRWRSDPFIGDALTSTDAGTDVVLLVDTFTRYFEPDNADAALRVLRAAGFSVAVAAPATADKSRPLCCGRTFLGHGLVDEARREAARMLDALSPHVARGAAIVGLEPSCLLTLRDEFSALGLGERARALASRAMLIEEFLVLEKEAGRLDLSLTALTERRALVHGHCHQKAFDVAGAVVTALRWIPGLDVEAIESTCCGMAGTFGYGIDHYDVSMRMAELSLLPAVRAAAADTLIVADGTSCRHQIADGTRESGRREAVHAIHVLARALPGGVGRVAPAHAGPIAS